jgi:hypothetical protein
MEIAVTPVSQAPRRYRFEIALAFALYMVALFGRVYLLKQIDDPVLKVAITLTPIFPILLMALAVYRFYRGIDEYYRVRLLKVMTIAGGITAIAAASWSFLEDVGAPALSNFGVIYILAGAFGVVTFLYRLEEAASEGRIGKLGRGISWLAIVGLTVAALWMGIAGIVNLPWIVPFAVLVGAGSVLAVVSLYIGPSTGSF